MYRYFVKMAVVILVVYRREDYYPFGRKKKFKTMEKASMYS